MTDIVNDWCKTAFGNAAAPMYDYYMKMNNAWNNMPIHSTILGNGVTFAPYLLSGMMQTDAESDFKAAEQLAPSIVDPIVRQSATDTINLERTLFNQWQQLYWIGTNVPRISLPLLSQSSDFSQISKFQEFSGTGSQDQNFATKISLAWTKDGLLVKWICMDPQISQLKASSIGYDNNIIGDDSVELVLQTGKNGETLHFAANPNGIRQDYKLTATGSRVDSWNPQWSSASTIGSDRWEVSMTIPFSSLDQSPVANECWRAAFQRHNGGRDSFASNVYPDQNFILLYFSSLSRTDHSIVRWSGMPARESKNDSSLSKDFATVGWQLYTATTEEQLVTYHDQSDMYWFRHPNNVPSDYWNKYLIPSVKSGGIAVLASYADIAVDQFFNDASLKLSRVSNELTNTERRNDYLAPGNWSMTPINLVSGFQAGITPWDAFSPTKPSRWTYLATAPYTTNNSFPYLLYTQYGKGLIVIAPDFINKVPDHQLLNNLYTNLSSLVSPGNSNFQINSQPPIVVKAENTYKYPVVLTNKTGSTVTYSLLRSPQGMLIQPQTGIITWTPSLNNVGTHVVIIEAKGSKGDCDYQSFKLECTQNISPMANAGDDQSLTFVDDGSKNYTPSTSKPIHTITPTPTAVVASPLPSNISSVVPTDNPIMPRATSTTPKTASVKVPEKPSEHFPIDVSGHWASESICKLLSQGILSGYKDNTIKPDKYITRAEAVTLICRASGFVPSNGNLTSFADNGHIPNWSRGYIRTAIQQGIIKGYPNNTFMPNNNITRAELIVVVMNAFDFRKAKQNTSVYKDGKTIPRWAKGYIEQAYTMGLAKGYKDNTFKPSKKITRAEVCAILVNAIETIDPS